MLKDKGAALFRRSCAGAAGLVLAGGLFSASAQERELKVGYMKNPIQDASLDIMEKWAKAHGVKLTPRADGLQRLHGEGHRDADVRCRPVRRDLAQ